MRVLLISYHITEEQKMMLRFLLVFVLLVFTSGFKIVCYYASWAQYRSGIGKFEPKDIDASMCTHIVYAYAKVWNIGLTFLNNNDGPSSKDVGMYKQFTNLKNDNPDLKILLAIAGNYERKFPYKYVVTTHSSRSTFANSVVAFLRDHSFDGVDVNWYYPDTRIKPAEPKNYIKALIQEMHNTFQTDAKSRGQKPLILSASLPGIKYIIDQGYDVPGMLPFLDFISITTFNFHGSWDKVVGNSAPLYPNPTEKGEQRFLNVDAIAKYYIYIGVPAQKLIIGIPTYGTSFKLHNAESNMIGSKAIDFGDAAPFTNTKGIMAFYEICQFIQSGAKVFEDRSKNSRYAIKGNQWVSFDDVTIVQNKANYVKTTALGGVMIRSLDMDDFNGTACLKGKYPLLTAITTTLRAIQMRSYLNGTSNKAISTSSGTKVSFSAVNYEGWREIMRMSSRAPQ